MDDLLVEIKTRYDFETIRQFIRFVMFCGKGYKIGPPLTLGLASLMLIVTLVLWILRQDWIYLLFFAIFAAVLLILGFLYFIKPKTVYKNTRKLMADEIVYRFFAEHLQIEAKTPGGSSAETVNYSVFKRIYEIHSAFYLRIGNGLAYIIRKDDLGHEQTERLRHFLADKFQRNYKICG